MRHLCYCVGLMEFVLVEKGISWKNFSNLSRHIFFLEARDTKENWLLHLVQGNGVLIL